MGSRERYAEQREADYQAKLDVEYEVWRSGGNPDAVDRDMVQGELDQGYGVDEIAAMELASQSRPEPEPEFHPWERPRDGHDEATETGCTWCGVDEPLTETPQGALCNECCEEYDRECERD